MALAVVCWGAFCAVTAAPAAAGDVNHDNGALSAAIYNVTPYTWTLVAASDDVLTVPASTLPPAASSLFGVWRDSRPFQSQDLFGGYYFSYDAYFTYRVDVLGGPPEYVTVAFSGCECNYIGHGIGQRLTLEVFNTVAAPPAGYSPVSNRGALPAATARPQIAWTPNTPQLFDPTFQLAGDWTVDASTSQGQAFATLLNSMCVGSAGTACSFTQTSPLQWGIGAPTKKGEAVNCTVGAAAARRSDAEARASQTPPEPEDPDWFEIEYETTQAASVSVGGSLTASAEVNLFGVVASEISVKVEAEHEWEEVKSFTKSSKVNIPSNNVASIWVAPTIGTVKGTLRLSNGSAAFTITNFTETRSGVTRDDLTPAFNVITRIRPMTAGELTANCSGRAAARAASGRKFGLRPGRGVGSVRLGQGGVARRLGAPLLRSAVANTSATANDCRVLDPRCDAVAGHGGTWVYRDLAVVFGADRRVSMLVSSGADRSAMGVGVGSSLSAVRSAYPGASCATSATSATCTLTGAQGARPVKTTFHFAPASGGRMTCDRVLMYRVATPGREVHR